MSVQINHQAIRRTAAKRGLLLYELASQAGVSRNSLYRAIRSGRCGVRVARAIATAIGMKPAQFIIFEEAPDPVRSEQVENCAVAKAG